MQPYIRVLFLSYNDSSIIEKVITTLTQCTNIPIIHTKRLYDIIYTLEHIDKCQIFVMTDINPDCIKSVADVLKQQYLHTVHSYWLNFDDTYQELANANLKDINQQTLNIFIQ